MRIKVIGGKLLPDAVNPFTKETVKEYIRLRDWNGRVHVDSQYIKNYFYTIHPNRREAMTFFRKMPVLYLAGTHRILPEEVRQIAEVYGTGTIPQTGCFIKRMEYEITEDNERYDYTYNFRFSRYIVTPDLLDNDELREALRGYHEALSSESSRIFMGGLQTFTTEKKPKEAINDSDTLYIEVVRRVKGSETMLVLKNYYLYLKCKEAGFCQ